MLRGYRLAISFDRCLRRKGRDVGSRGLLLLVTLFGCALFSCQGETESEMPTTSSAITDSVRSADGAMIHYTDYGTGSQALVFVHCWSCDRSYWEPVVEHFKADYHVVTLDLAGHGESGGEREQWTMPAYGADVAAVVRDLGLTEVILVGHSMAGAVIIEAARLLPGLVVALIGVDTYQSLGLSFSEDQAEQFLARFRPDFKTATDGFVKSMFPPNADSALVERIARDMSAAPADIAVASIKNYLTHDIKSSLVALDVPIRTVNCDKFATNVDLARELVESFEVKLMPGYGHFLYLENPAAFNDTLAGVIAEFWKAPMSEM